jgi:adhesin transport system membrane fusion protein
MNLFWFLRKPSKAGTLSRGAYDPKAGSFGAHLVLWITAFSMAAMAFWAYFANIDQVTRASGVVIPSSRSQIIQSPEGGILEMLLVKEGDIVEKNTVLARLERTKTESAYLEARAKAASLKAAVARLNAEIYGGLPKFPPEVEKYPELRFMQMALYNKRHSAIEQEVAALEKILVLAKRELDMNKPLLAQGDVSQTDVIRLERQVADIEAQITNKRNKYFQDAAAEQSKAQDELAGVEQTLTQRANLLEQTELRAPLKGVVKNVRITTLGGVIRPGEEVMQIVPLEEDLFIEAKVDPASIAFIKVGQDVTVKIDAYDFTVYGGLEGKLTFVSADTLSEDLKQGEKPYFRARVKTSGRQFSGRPDQSLDIFPGMTAVIEIKTGSNTVMHYLIKPVTKTLSESMGER